MSVVQCSDHNGLSRVAGARASFLVYIYQGGEQKKALSGQVEQRGLNILSQGKNSGAENREEMCKGKENVLKPG